MTVLPQDLHAIDRIVLQSFVEEMVDIAEAKWLREYYITDDKKGLIAKVGVA